MKFNLFFFIWAILSVYWVSVLGQEKMYNTSIDTIKSSYSIDKNIIPISLIAVGLIVNHTGFEKNIQAELRNQVGNSYELKIDDYLQYFPIVELYTADVLGIKAKNHWFDQTKYLFISNFLTGQITHGLKRLTKKTRPNLEPYSFPSGHSSFAFSNASVLYHEFKDNSPILAYSGYVFSTTTGVFRMINNRHWLSDVLVGAGIGILTTELVYQIKPFKKFNPFIKKANVVIIPQISEDKIGLYFVHNF